MKKFISFGIAAVFMSVALLNGIHLKRAAAADTGEIMFIMDASSSMLDKDGGSTTRIDKAKTALKQTLSSISPDVKVGLRVYGSQVPDTDKAAGCQDSKLITRPTANGGAAISAALDGIQAKGWTLMGKSLQDVQSDFSGSGPKTVILLSDGIDTCAPPDACEVAKTLSASGTKIKVDTLGLLVNNSARSQLTCIAQGSGGDYFDINSIDRLQDTLKALTAREVNLFTAQGVPIKGTLRSDEAPVMLANTRYTDTLQIPQVLYYGFEALPNQKITMNVKLVAHDSGLDGFDFLHVTPYVRETGQQIGYATFTQISFGGSDPRMAVLTLDTSKFTDDISKPTLIAFQIEPLPSKSSKGIGANIPLELKITTEGGTAPNNKTPVADTAQQTGGGNKNGGPSTLTTVLFTLLGVVIIAAGAYIVKRFLQKHSGNTGTFNGPQITTSQTPPTEMPTSQQPPTVVQPTPPSNNDNHADTPPQTQ